MAVTRLERKGRKNISRAKNRKKVIKLLSSQPVIQNVDIEAIKAEFEANKGKSKTKEPSKVAAKQEETVATEKQAVKSVKPGAHKEVEKTEVKKEKAKAEKDSKEVKSTEVKSKDKEGATQEDQEIVKAEKSKPAAKKSDDTKKEEKKPAAKPASKA